MMTMTDEARQSRRRNIEHEALGHTLPMRRLAARAGVSETTARRWDADVDAVSLHTCGLLSRAWYELVMTRLPDRRIAEIQRERER